MLKLALFIKNLVQVINYADQDQSSSLRVNLYFCPVGTAFSSDYIFIGTTYNGTVQANNASKDTILQQANTYANHGSKVVYTVSSKRVQENW